MDLLSKYNESVQNKNEVLPESAAAEFYNPDTPKMIRWVMRYSGGLVKDEKQAGYVLIGFAAVAMAISFYFIFGTGGGPKMPLPKGAKYIYPPGEHPRLQMPLQPSK